MKQKNRVLLIVDVQNDFLPGGALGVEGGEKLLPVINDLIRYWGKTSYPLYFSRDWHPSKTVHFSDLGGTWPEHCVQNTPGAAFAGNLYMPDKAEILSKGMNPRYDGYSAFDAKNADGKLLPDLLESLGTETIFIAGLATDYCVRATSLDALKNGYQVIVIRNGVKGVDDEKSKQSLEEIQKHGGRLMDAAEVIRGQKLQFDL